MKVAHIVAEVLREKGIKHVFCVSGGASLHIIHAIDDTEGIDYVCPQHEQAASFAADAYARLNGLGCALATSGPGLTNLVTGIASSYYDSIPVIYIAGQVTTSRLARNFGSDLYGVPRQFGFQETPAVEICKAITKYAVEVTDPSRVRYELDRCIAQAKCGRPGPTLLSLPDDVQRADG